MKMQITCTRAEANHSQLTRCMLTLAEMDTNFVKMSRMLSIAGNEVRLKILFLLNLERELCVCDLSDILNMKISAISQHLRKLKDRDIVFTKRNAQTIYYSLADEYKVIFIPFFELIDNDKILETI